MAPSVARVRRGRRHRPTTQAEVLSVQFQPMVQVQGNRYWLFALEASVSSSLVVAGEDASATTCDRAALGVVLDMLSGHPAPPRLAVNVAAAALAQDPVLVMALSELAQGEQRLIVEVGTAGVSMLSPSLSAAITELRAQGAEIALDDLGAGHSDFRQLIVCRPDFIKVDGFVVRGCADDPYRQGILESVVVLAASVDARLVAQSVVNRQDFQLVRNLGIDLIQGPWLAPAVAAPALDQWELLRGEPLPIATATLGSGLKESFP